MPAPPSIPAFAIARLPRIEFGAGAIRKLPAIAAQYGNRLLIVTGAASFTHSAAGEAVFQDLQAAGFSLSLIHI
jgi:alcohol dehydrogenase class IV